MLHYLSPKCLVSALFDLKVSQNKVEYTNRKPKAVYQRGIDNAMTERKKKTQTMVSKILYRKRLFEQEELEDTKGVIKIHISRRTDNTMAKRKRTKGQTTIYKSYT
jgi:hypothetical protein